MMCRLVLRSRPHWLFCSTAKHLKTETEKYTRTYGMRPDDCSSVREMCLSSYCGFGTALQKRFGIGDYL